MEWDVQFDEDFAAWLLGLERETRNELMSHISLLRQFGPHLGRPNVDTLKGSAFRNMKELRIQHRGDPCASSSPSIRPEGRSSSSAAIKGAISDGTKRTSQSPMHDFGAT